MTAVVRAVVSAVTRGVVATSGASGQVEHIQNGNFDDGSTGWTVGVDWSIAGGQADGSNGLSELVNTLAVPVQSNADISTFSADLLNSGNNQVIISLRSDIADHVIYSDTGSGTIGPTIPAAGTRGPYHSLVIVNNDGADPISIDNITLAY